MNKEKTIKNSQLRSYRGSTAAFINAIRQALGLDPIPNTVPEIKFAKAASIQNIPLSGSWDNSPPTLNWQKARIQNKQQ